MKKIVLFIALFLLTSLCFGQNYDKFYYNTKSIGTDSKWSEKIESTGFIRIDYETLIIHHHENDVKCIDFKLRSGNELLEDKTSYTGFDKLSAMLFVDKINLGNMPSSDVKMVIWSNKDQTSIWFTFIVDGVESIFYCYKVESVVNGKLMPITNLIIHE